MLKIEGLAQLIGSEVEDSYGRSLGTLVSIMSDVNGEVRAVEVKIVDRGLETVAADRIILRDGKLLVIPDWKYEALKVIEALDRAYRRRRALETMSASDIPGDVVEDLKRGLSEEIKSLKIKAEEVKRIIKDRIAAIEDESIQVARAIVSIQVLYFSGEVSEKNYTQSINHLRKLREKLIEEKNDAKKTLDKLEKTVEAITTPQEPKKQEEKKQAPQAPPQAPITVKVEEG
ncbi:MAG: CdvA-like protein [Acidilobaceae archaeon]|nr:CdvA-like protein [Desulfurococcaceae archaeon]MCC6060682.1 CdvA-like protein [Desulfurococcaceae archaeon]MDT7866387.1 CdvA-like protein [Desulfurococcales archaeon]